MPEDKIKRVRRAIQNHRRMGDKKREAITTTAETFENISMDRIESIADQIYGEKRKPEMMEAAEEEGEEEIDLGLRKVGSEKSEREEREAEGLEGVKKMPGYPEEGERKEEKTELGFPSEKRMGGGPSREERKRRKKEKERKEAEEEQIVEEAKKESMDPNREVKVRFHLGKLRNPN